jgi:hypothetical protein
MTVVLLLVVVSVATLMSCVNAGYQCSNKATITVVESIPVQVSVNWFATSIATHKPNHSKVNLGPVPNTTYDAWHYLVRKAKKTIDIAAFYVRLTDGSNYPPVAEGWQGAVSGQSNAHCKFVLIVDFFVSFEKDVLSRHYRRCEARRRRAACAEHAQCRFS